MKHDLTQSKWVTVQRDIAWKF